jgi:hypothetical protein
MDNDLIEYRIRRNEFWKLLWSVNEEYTKLVNSIAEVEFSFAEYIDANYGLVIHYDNQGNITGDYEISDEPKYTFCLLKHR